MSLPWHEIRDALQSEPPVRLSGRVIRVGGLVLQGLMPGAKMGMMCRLHIPGAAESVPAEVVALRDGEVSLMPLSAVSGITVGTEIEPVDHDPSVPVGDDMVGRVLDGWGRPIDGGAPLRASARYPLQPPPLNPMERGLIERPLSVGLVSRPCSA